MENISQNENDQNLLNRLSSKSRITFQEQIEKLVSRCNSLLTIEQLMDLKIFLFDEPFAGLFPKMLDQVKELLKTLKNEGPRAFYRGFLPQWYRFAPYAILQFTIWEQLSTWYGFSTT